MVHRPPPSHRRASAAGGKRPLGNLRSASATAVLTVVTLVALALGVPVVAAGVSGDPAAPRPVRPGTRSLVNVRLEASSSPATASALRTTVALHWDRALPEGVVVIRSEGRRLATTAVAGGTVDGLAQVPLPTLSPGRHELSAAFRVHGRLIGKSDPVTVLCGEEPSATPTPHPSTSDRPTSSTAKTTPSSRATPSPSATRTPERSPSPTTTPTTTSSTGTPTSSPGDSCEATPSSCGYPDASNTGPSPSTSFTLVPGQLRSGPGWAWNAAYESVFVSGPGAVLDGLDIDGAVVIDAPDVVLRNSRIHACGGQSDSDVVAIRYKNGDPSYRGANASVIDNDIDGSPAGCDHRSRSGVRDVYGAAPDVLVQGNDIHGTGNGVTVEYEGVVADNWVHSLGHLPGDHHSGISTHGGAAGVIVRHNTVLLFGQDFPGGGGVSGAITVYSDFGHAQNTTIEDNFVSGGSYVIYGGNSGDSYRTPASSIAILDNRFACGEWLYGPVAAFDADGAGNRWSGNFCDGTGESIGP